MSTTYPNRTELRARIMALPPEVVADTLINALSAAGGQPEWDSETIEQVLNPFEDIVSAIGMPWVGSTGDDAENVNANEPRED